MIIKLDSWWVFKQPWQICNFKFLLNMDGQLHKERNSILNAYKKKII